MTKLKLGPIADDKPVKLSIELPAAVHRDLVSYAAALSRETGQAAAEPSKLIAPMIERFMATDRAFTKALRRHDRTVVHVIGGVLDGFEKAYSEPSSKTD